jgi:hypothetical protein
MTPARAAPRLSRRTLTMCIAEPWKERVFSTVTCSGAPESQASAAEMRSM